MSLLTESVCSLRLEQKGTSTLLPPASFETWIRRAEERVNELTQSKPMPESEEYFEADCLIQNLDEFQQFRAEIIWDLARDGAGDVDLMTDREAEIYTQLVGLAEDLRGEAA